MTGDGDEAFASVFRAEWAPVTALVTVLLGDRDEADDVTAEAFVRLYAQWRRVSHYDRPGAWVRRVAMNLAFSRRSRKTASFEPRPATEPVDIDLQRAILSLPKKQRAAIVLHYFEDRPVAEIAEILACAASTAKVHLHRGRARLAELLGETHAHR